MWHKFSQFLVIFRPKFGQNLLIFDVFSIKISQIHSKLTVMVTSCHLITELAFVYRFENFMFQKSRNIHGRCTPHFAPLCGGTRKIVSQRPNTNRRPWRLEWWIRWVLGWGCLFWCFDRCISREKLGFLAKGFGRLWERVGQLQKQRRSWTLELMCGIWRSFVLSRIWQWQWVVQGGFLKMSFLGVKKVIWGHFGVISGHFRSLWGQIGSF